MNIMFFCMHLCIFNYSLVTDLSMMIITIFIIMIMCSIFFLNIETECHVTNLQLFCSIFWPYIFRIIVRKFTETGLHVTSSTGSMNDWYVVSVTERKLCCL